MSRCPCAPFSSCARSSRCVASNALHRHSADLASCALPFAALPFRILGNIAETDAAGETLLVVHKLLIGVTCWLAWLRFMQTALKKSETLGPMVLMVQSMLTGDVFEFLIVFTFFLLAFAEVIFSITLPSMAPRS